MEIAACTWPEETTKILQRKHNIDQDEVEEIFVNDPRFRLVEEGHRAGENIYAAFGQTEAGRYLLVFFAHSGNGPAKILCARDMKRAERIQHEQA